MLTAHTFERRPLGSFEKRSIIGHKGERESENGYSLFSYWSCLVDGVLGNKGGGKREIMQKRGWLIQMQKKVSPAAICLIVAFTKD